MRQAKQEVPEDLLRLISSYNGKQSNKYGSKYNKSSFNKFSTYLDSDSNDWRNDNDNN